MKGEGMPHLVKGIESPSADVRTACLQALDPEETVRHAKETMPALRRLLADPVAVIRQQAAGRLSWYGAAARDHLPALQQLAESDPDPDVRDAAVNSIKDIREAMSGKRGTGR